MDTDGDLFKPITAEDILSGRMDIYGGGEPTQPVRIPVAPLFICRGGRLLLSQGLGWVGGARAFLIPFFFGEGGWPFRNGTANNPTSKEFDAASSLSESVGSEAASSPDSRILGYGREGNASRYLQP